MTGSSSAEGSAELFIAAASVTFWRVSLTTFDLDEYVYEALRAGASGFVRNA